MNSKKTLGLSTFVAFNKHLTVAQLNAMLEERRIVIQFEDMTYGHWYSNHQRVRNVPTALNVNGRSVTFRVETHKTPRLRQVLHMTSHKEDRALEVLMGTRDLFHTTALMALHML